MESLSALASVTSISLSTRPHPPVLGCPEALPSLTMNGGPSSQGLGASAL